jgi:hypothetical protein
MPHDGKSDRDPRLALALALTLRLGPHVVALALRLAALAVLVIGLAAFVVLALGCVAAALRAGALMHWRGECVQARVPCTHPHQPEPANLRQQRTPPARNRSLDVLNNKLIVLGR